MKRKRSRSEIADRNVLLNKIKDFTRSVLKNLCNGRSPVVILDRFQIYCTDQTGNCTCSFDLPKIKERLVSFQRECYTRRMDIFVRVLLIVQQLLQENKHASKRDIYYMHPSIFLEQAVVDRAINDICILLSCSRHNLNVVSVGKGYETMNLEGMSWIQTIEEDIWLVMGWLRFVEGEKMFDCIKSPSTGHPIPVHVEEVKGIRRTQDVEMVGLMFSANDVVSVADYILVVEKEAVFQRLSNDSFCDTHRCIVITGKGYPDVSTRRFLRLLIENLCLPVYCLVDCDPYGFDILTIYRFGSMEMAYDAKSLRVPEVCWLGAFPTDSVNYHLPEQCLFPLTAEDKKKAEAMLLRCYLQHEVPQWRSELQVMLQRGVKFEIEALSVVSISFLSDEYIPSKIQNAVHI